jgi:hypothetical protein
MEITSNYENPKTANTSSIALHYISTLTTSPANLPPDQEA